MPNSLSTARAAALYIGALLGPGLLLLPGLAARLAGPASIVAWVGLLALSGLFAAVFTALGVRFRSRDGVAGYAAAGLGPAAGRAVAWCFLAGVVLGAPLVCLIGAAYVANLFGGGRAATVAIAAVLLAVVVTLTLGGARASAAVQCGLVAVLVALIVVAVAGSAGDMQARHWTPLAPHGWPAVGSAAAVLMLSFVGWEAIAPMTGRLRDPARQLPRIIAIAFAVTAVLYLALAAATISVLGPQAGGAAPLAALLRVAIGPAGVALAAAAAVSLTLAAVNAYLSGAVEMAAELYPAERQCQGAATGDRRSGRRRTRRRGDWRALCRRARRVADRAVPHRLPRLHRRSGAGAGRRCPPGRGACLRRGRGRPRLRRLGNRGGCSGRGSRDRPISTRNSSN